MKKIKLKYNPYLVTTDVTVDGQKPKANSALNVGKKRLQEWVENLPQILLDEYRDSNVSIEFTGLKSDYEDIEAAFESYKNKMSSKCKLNQVTDITEAENKIKSIFKEIITGPISELRDKKIKAAFEKANDSRFEINVVATMSSGKSTLINALLGKQLMPAANEATTATIVKIVDTDQEYFSAVAYDKSNNRLKEIKNVSLEDMKKLNSDIKVSTIVLFGKIPFVNTDGMKLVLVDTPGPNNSRDKRHEEMTYQMIADSDKSLVLYVMNGQQLGINDEKIFLDYICESMKAGGKQSRERFIFAINKMDAFKPKNEGVDCIERALTNVKKGLEDRGIFNPNIFPVTACAALELRTNDDEPMALDNFTRGTKKYEALHFDNYYHYSNLPQSVRTGIENLLSDADDDALIEIHTGIVSIEQAIVQYVNKYARTTKINDLVLAFNDRLNELAAFANLEKTIRESKSAKATLEQQINKIKTNIQSAENAKKYADRIERINLKSTIEKDVITYINNVNKKLSALMIGRSNKLEKSKAKKECEQLEKECKAISIQIKVQINKILDDAYNETISKTKEEYKKSLAELNIGVNDQALSFNPVNLISASLADLSLIIKDNTKTEDESYDVKEKRKVKVEGGFFRKAASRLTFGLVDDYTIEEKIFTQKISKYVDYVDMNDVVSEYLVPFRKRLTEIQEKAINHVDSETKLLKEHLKGELKKIDKLVSDKLDDLLKTENDSKAKAAEIAKKEEELKWLENIQKQVNDIIKF